MAKVRLAVIDDHSLFREGVISILRNEPEIEIIGEGASADDAVCIAKCATVDVMLLDVSMPGGGIAALQKMAAAKVFPKTVMLTVSEANEDFLAAMKAGAQGYVLKGIHKSELVRAVLAVRDGRTFIDPVLADRMSGWSCATAKPERVDFPEPEQLTPREAEVLELVSRGLTNKEVARRLQLTHRTIKNYMTSIMGKLQVRNRVEAALSVERSRK